MKTFNPPATIMSACLLGTALSPAAAQQADGLDEPLPTTTKQLTNPKSANVAIVGHVVEPKQLKPTPARLSQLQMPEGFRIDVFADGLVNPRMIAVAGDGTVYVTRRELGDVVMLRDEDGDGRSDGVKVVASRPMMHGIAIDGDTVYLTTVADVYRTTRKDDGTLEPLERLVDDLPAGGQHPNRMVLPGPDGKLYVSVGSTCNACGETDAENATMLRMDPDSGSRTIFASGLRNTIGYGFVPGTDRLYGMDHGIDWLGDNEQHEELNHIVEGAKYGWPYVFADGKHNPQDYPPGGITMEEWTEQSKGAIGLYTPHSAPMQMAFYTGDAFPEDYRGDAFVAMRGSWNRQPPSGYEVVRIAFEDGEPVSFEPFIKGFVVEDGDGWGHLGRLAGLAQAPDGSMYLSDDTNGIVYRITYEGTAEGRPTANLWSTNEAGSDVRILAGAVEMASPRKESGLAIDLVEASSGQDLNVTSTAFEDGAAIPELHAAEGGNVSPPLNWDEGPSGTESYVVLAEDPDVGQNAPFIHWVVYNVPAGTTSLAEGLPGSPRLAQPEGLNQGPSDYGATGYYGPRPPRSDPAHNYHFEVFALSEKLALPHGASRQQVLDAMDGLVLASGEIVGTYER